MEIIVSLMCFAAFYFGFPKTSKSFLNFWLLRKPIEKNKAIILSITWEFICLQFLQFGWMFLLITFVAKGGNSIKDIPEANVLLLILAFLLSAIYEEVYFRATYLLLGYAMLKFFNKDLSYVLGLISSIVFGLAHLDNYTRLDVSNLIWISTQFVGGLTLWWFAKRYNILVAMLCHFAFNSILIAPIFLFMK